MLEHGKAVLCEKPIGLTGGQAEEMADFAKEMVRMKCVHATSDVISERCIWKMLPADVHAYPYHRSTGLQGGQHLHRHVT